jgi:hypothetical protein
MSGSREKARTGAAKAEEAIERERREKALDVGLEDSFPASDPIAAVQPARAKPEPDTSSHAIARHDKSNIVGLSDGSRWRIWPGDSATTLQWVATTRLTVSKVVDEVCSHVLVNPSDGSRVRVIEATRDWPIEQVKRSLRDG